MLRDAQGNEHGMSRDAAREGIAKCCLARLLWNIPVLAVSPVLLERYGRSKFHAANPRLRILVELVTTTVLICVGVYPAQAVFTQEASIPASRVEAEFRDAAKHGVQTEYFYNKGL